MRCCLLKNRHRKIYRTNLFANPIWLQYIYVNVYVPVLSYTPGSWTSKNCRLNSRCAFYPSLARILYFYVLIANLRNNLNKKNTVVVRRCERTCCRGCTYTIKYVWRKIDTILYHKTRWNGEGKKTWKKTFDLSLAELYADIYKKKYIYYIYG